jgi:adenylate cyclase
MHDPPRILIVDDNETNRDILQARLNVHGYELRQAGDGKEALVAAREFFPDLILLDVMMPKLDGIEVCRRLKADSSLPFMPIVLVTAKSDSQDIVAGLDAGADDYLTKPTYLAALVARVRYMLRIKRLHDQVQAQATELANWNENLERRVSEQLSEIERVSRLRRFLAPQIADLILSTGDEAVLDSHRRDVAVLFCDLRGFTAFAESAEPEEVMSVLQEYHACLGVLTRKSEGTLERFTGDGMIVLFNDPLPCLEPCLRAVRLAVEMQGGIEGLSADWRKRGYDLGFGIGIAYGFATLGRIGFEERYEYTAIGSVMNLAARLCAEARSGQIVIESKVHAAINDVAETQPLGELLLRGFHRPVRAYNVQAMLR